MIRLTAALAATDRPRLRAAVALALLAVLSLPLFFDIYRAAAFNTAPRDDYAPYLLYLVGDGGALPGAPFVYRFLSVAVAVPFYHALPGYIFSNLPPTDPAYLQAVEALSFSSWLWLALTPAVIYVLARRSRAGRGAAAIAALLTLPLSGFLARVGIDPLAVFVICLLLLWVDRPLLFAPLALLSSVLNEKASLVLAVALAGRLLAARRAGRPFGQWPALTASLAAVAVYFAVTLVYDAPGNEAQTNPALFLSHARSTLAYTLSAKGRVLHALPALVVAGLAALALRYRRASGFQAADTLALVALLALALVADVSYNVGRIVMHAYPFYLPAAALFVGELVEGRQ